MRVEQIKIKEFKHLQDLSFDVNGQHILLLGENGVGKSSIIQLINIALGNNKNVPELQKAKAQVIFSNSGEKIEVNISYKDGKPVLKIKGNDLFIDNNKGAIASLFGAVDFDVNEFLELSKTKAGQKKQVEIYKSFFDKEVIDFLEKMDNKAKIAYDERTQLNKDIVRIKGAMESSHLKHLPDFELRKIQRVDATKLLNEIKIKNENNAKILSFKERMKEKQKEIFKLKGDLQILENDYAKGEKWLTENYEEDTIELSKQIDGVTQQNRDFDEAQTLLKQYSELQVLQNDTGELTAQIESTRESIADTIKQMDVPVEGLMYDDERLTYNGIPVTDQNLSSSEIIELGLKMQLAKNNTGIMLIQRAESIGNERWALIKEIAEKNNMQIIAEEVRRGGNNLVVEIFS